MNLLAKVTGIPEVKLAYYLDMYYQLRDAYEAAKVEERLQKAITADFKVPQAYPNPPRTMNTPEAPAEVTGADTEGSAPEPPPGGL